MQSPFSFRRFAPAFDYLGSPFSAFFRPLLLGFPVHTFVLSFFFLPLDLCFLSSAFVLFLVTQLPVLLFSSLPGFPHSGSPVLIGFFRPLCLSPSVQPDFSNFSSGSAYSAFLYCFLSSFPASLPQPFDRCSSLALTQDVSPWLLFSFVHISFRFSTTQLLFLHFLLSTVSASQLASTVSRFCFRFPVFPLSSCLVSRAFRPISSTLPSVCFLSSFPASLPQLFHRCFPFGSLLRDQRLTSASFRPLPF